VPVTSKAEFYFIVAMMILILIVSAVAVIAFFRTYKKEMAEKRNRTRPENKESKDPS